MHNLVDVGKCKKKQFNAFPVPAGNPCRDALGYRIVGSPRSIENKKYQRNAFIFNFVFVFEVNTDTALFEPVILKLGAAFKTYEVCK